MNRCIWLILVVAVIVSSRKKDESQADIDERLIQEYIEKENITNAERTQYGVYYVIDSVGDGSGIYPYISSTVRAQYRGYFLDGTDFDSGNFDDNPVNFALSQTIAGWQIGMPFFERGSVGRLLIPSNYGYGREGRANIPPNSVLIFDIKLHNVY
jgi:FKBP-type peptidyl-prolyl cis-trans isomerase FkpA